MLKRVRTAFAFVVVVNYNQVVVGGGDYDDANSTVSCSCPQTQKELYRQCVKVSSSSCWNSIFLDTYLNSISPSEKKRKSLQVWSQGFQRYSRRNDISGKNIKNTQEVKKKKRLLIGQDKTKCANFRGSPLFRSYVQHKNKQAISLLIFCQLGAWMLLREEKEDFLENSTCCLVLSNQKAFCLTSCVFLICLQNAGSQLCFRFFWVDINEDNVSSPKSL